MPSGPSSSESFIFIYRVVFHQIDDPVGCAHILFVDNIAVQCHQVPDRCSSTFRRIRISFLRRQIRPTHDLQVNLVRGVQRSGGEIEFFPHTRQKSKRTSLVRCS